jgi:AcrR family transcriptional regulator
MAMDGALGSDDDRDEGSRTECVQPATMRADARRNRAQILAAAVELFADKGVAVPVDDIARKACVGVGTLYRHFPTKEALFEAVLVSRISELTAKAKALAESDDPGRALFDFLQRMVREATAKRDLLDALAGIEVNVKALGRELELAVGDLLRRAQEAGAVRVDVGIVDLMHLVMGGCVFDSRSPSHHDEGCSGDRLLAVVCDGLRVSTPAS